MLVVRQQLHPALAPASSPSSPANGMDARERPVCTRCQSRPRRAASRAMGSSTG
ncbi:hypothetical protein ACFQ60_07935 [Streptomyces zhihengii]